MGLIRSRAYFMQAFRKDTTFCGAQLSEQLFLPFNANVSVDALKRKTGGYLSKLVRPRLVQATAVHPALREKLSLSDTL
jgi:hypothetical protein